MKFNWGVGITVFIALFVGFMVMMVLKAGKQNHELITEDYYEKELEFKDILTKKENALQAFKEQLKCVIEDGQVVFYFPEEVTSEISGTIYFFKPSKQDDDATFQIEASNNQQKIALDRLASGMYKIKADWYSNGKGYYNESTIVIP